MKNTLAILGVLISLAVLTACHEDGGDEGNPDQPLVFQSLIAANDTIFSGETTQITATASGYKLVYHWSASSGDILNSGAQVIYASPPCISGKFQVTCQVKDGNGQSETKSISIVVQ
jgi:hypothetical protein